MTANFWTNSAELSGPAKVGKHFSSDALFRGGSQDLQHPKLSDCYQCRLEHM